MGVPPMCWVARASRRWLTWVDRYGRRPRLEIGRAFGSPDRRRDPMFTRSFMLLAALAVLTFGTAALSAAEFRFPPPEFDTGHTLPVTTTPEPRTLTHEVIDAGVLLLALAVATWIVYRKRSRRWVIGLSLASLAYFGFYRNGCVCAIGSIQNVALGMFDRSYAIPLTVLVFFLAPLVFALFGGRVFCAGVCPHGALQDLVLIKPVKVPGWLEHSLGLIPFVFLGAGVVFAATGTAFVICRYDPFVPLFRLTGSVMMLTLGAAFLVVGMFVGRPYCRFLCPYGALLRLASLVSKWRVRVTPDFCTQCRLCEHSCPYGAMRQPVVPAPRPEPAARQRRRLAVLLLALPVLVTAGALVGASLAPAASRLHPTVELAERYVRQLQAPVQYPPMTAEALSLERAEADPEALLASARQIRERLSLAAWLFGGWVGLVIGVKLLALSVRVRRTDFEPDRGTCVACARCFEFCPNELVRRGGLPAQAVKTPELETAAAGDAVARHH
jgi:NosR/NirI family transcriptional regulator, nitrous oxide reductase regulator